MHRVVSCLAPHARTSTGSAKKTNTKKLRTALDYCGEHKDRNPFNGRSYLITSDFKIKGNGPVYPSGSHRFTLGLSVFQNLCFFSDDFAHKLVKKQKLNWFNCAFVQGNGIDKKPREKPVKILK